MQPKFIVERLVCKVKLSWVLAKCGSVTGTWKQNVQTFMMHAVWEECECHSMILFSESIRRIEEIVGSQFLCWVIHFLKMFRLAIYTIVSESRPTESGTRDGFPRYFPTITEMGAAFTFLQRLPCWTGSFWRDSVYKIVGKNGVHVRKK